MLVFQNFCTHYFHNIWLHGYSIVKLLDPPHHSKVRVKFSKKMSMTSSATVSRDWEVPSTNILRDRLCLISITRGDGTPMDASSISEDDIMEICMKKGHTCPFGVPLFSHGIHHPFQYHGRVKMCELWLSRHNRVVK